MFEPTGAALCLFFVIYLMYMFKQNIEIIALIMLHKKKAVGHGMSGRVVLTPISMGIADLAPVY